MIAGPELRFEKLSADIIGSTLDSWRVIIEANASMRLARPHPLEESFFLCEHGTVEIELDSKVYTLSRGDSLHCRAKALLSVANPDSEPASYILAGRAAQGALANLFGNLPED